MKKKYNILHLDDNPDFIRLIKQLFENVNINYEYTYRDDEAYNFLKRKIPDIMIVDLIRNGDCCDYLPGINFIKKINSEYPNLKIVVLTSTPYDMLEKKLDKYIVEYIEKSFQPTKLKNKIIEILEPNNKNDSIFGRKDSPIQMILAYQQLISKLIYIIDDLKEDDVFNIKRILEILWPYLKKIVSPLSLGVILGISVKLEENINLSDDFVVNYQAVAGEKELLLDWNETDKISKALIFKAIKHDMKSAFCWNCHYASPKFIHPKNIAFPTMLTKLCHMPTGEILYLLLVRNNTKNIFLSHEMQAMMLLSKIVGERISYTFLHDGFYHAVSNTL